MNKVLIIDDSSTVRRLVSNCVRALGGDIVGLAEDGDEGIEKFKTLKPDIVLLDITMPNKDGRECLKEIMVIDFIVFVVMFLVVGFEEVKIECFIMGVKVTLLVLIWQNMLQVKGMNVLLGLRREEYREHWPLLFEINLQVYCC
jgi:two-component system chemotaxis response regulator CheY